MKFDKAIGLFQDEVRKALDQGYEIKGVEAEPGGDDEILITATSPDDSVLVAIGVDCQGLLAGLTEYVFAHACGQVEALQRLREMSSVSGR